MLASTAGFQRYQSWAIMSMLGGLGHQEEKSLMIQKAKTSFIVKISPFGFCILCYPICKHPPQKFFLRNHGSQKVQQCNQDECSVVVWKQGKISRVQEH